MRLLYDRFSSRERVHAALLLAEVISIAVAVVFACGATSVGGTGLVVLIGWAIVPRLGSRCIEWRGRPPDSPLVLLVLGATALWVGAGVLSQIGEVWGRVDAATLTAILALWAVSAFLFHDRLYRFFDVALLATVIIALVERQPGTLWAIPTVMVTWSISLALRHLLYDVYVERTPAPINVQSSQVMGWLGGAVISAIFLLASFSLEWVEARPATVEEASRSTAAITDEESGDEKSGDEKSGDEKSGDEKSGDEKSGDEKSGDEKSGDEKSGDEKSGDEKSGDEKSGEEASASRPGDAERERSDDASEGETDAGPESGVTEDGSSETSAAESTATSAAENETGDGTAEIGVAVDGASGEDAGTAAGQRPPGAPTRLDPRESATSDPTDPRSVVTRRPPSEEPVARPKSDPERRPTGVENAGAGSPETGGGEARSPGEGTGSRGAKPPGVVPPIRSDGTIIFSTNGVPIRRDVPTRIDAKEGPPIPLSDAEDRPIPDADAETHDSETAGTDSETRDTGSGANAEGERAQGSIAPRDPAGVDARESAPPAPPISDPIREFSSDPEFRPTGSDRSATEKTGIGTLSNPAVTELRAGRSDSPRGDRIGSEVEPTAPPRTAPALGWLLAGTVAVLGLLAARSFRRDDTPDRNAADRGIAGPVSIVPLAAAVARARNRVASTPEEAVLLAYDELQVTLARQRKQRREHETPLEHQRRLVAFSAELRAPLGFLVGHVYDVVYGHRSLPPSELDRVRSSCEKIRRRLR